MSERLLTPTKITAWLDCAHYLTLQRRLDAGTLEFTPQPFGSLAQLLADKGLEHEAQCLASYREQGLTVYEVPGRETGERFADWVDRVGNPLELDVDVLYQLPMIHDGLRGIADFLVRCADPETGLVRWEPVDAKLARAGAKPGHVMQLCFYADAIEALTGHAPEALHVWLGSGRIETIHLVEVRAYWKRLRSQLDVVMNHEDTHDATVPAPCSHCEFCEFSPVCEQQWRDADSLVYVAGIRRADRDALESAGVTTLQLLAAHHGPVDDVHAARLDRLTSQAVLQVEARDEGRPTPPFRLFDRDDPAAVQGFAAMPAPDDGDLFLDYEGHPFWQPDAGLFFLFGALTRQADATWAYDATWAHDRDEERHATQSLIERLAQRHIEFPGMHVYHYNHTERSALERLATDHGCDEALLAGLVEAGLFIDLLGITKNALQAGIESYGLKYTERLAGYERGHDIDQGAGAVVEYEAYTKVPAGLILERIAAYNEDDVRATLALRDWLLAQRPADLDWRPACYEPESTYPEIDAQVAALHDFDPGTPQHLLGDLLGYWLREWRATTAPRLAKTSLDLATLLADPDVVAGLEFIKLTSRVAKNGKELVPHAEFRFPDQIIGPTLHPQAARVPSVVYGADEGTVGFASVAGLDSEKCTLTLTWNTRSQDLGTFPSCVIVNDWVQPKPKPEALSWFAASVLDPAVCGSPNPAAMALLGRDLPKFTPGHGPEDDLFSDDLAAIVGWAQHLDDSVVAIQGPPGTGKTFTGAHIVHQLVKAGKRIGITAMSHHAIDNLLHEIVDVFGQAGELESLRAIRKHEKPASGGLVSTKYTSSNPPCANSDYNVVAGTTWLFASESLRNVPVDFLIVDEAGQLALADAVAAATSADNVILLGDPLQLPQVATATHPGGAGHSVLQHLLGDDTTMPPTRGVFLTHSRRMHPDICRVISRQIYEDRLTSHESCALQDTDRGTGLRWLRAEHVDRSTESPEEAALVANELAGLVGVLWTDRKGRRRPLDVGDFMVVAPYNDQVKLMRSVLDANPATRGTRVGTVDKFQGQQAPVVFFTMTTSDADNMPRGAEFLFSRNRLNVAISRAQCLAYIVCTEDLLDSRARDVDEMKLISTLCAFVDECT